MDHGPVDFVMIGFPDSQAAPEVAAGIKALVDSGTIRVLDLIFVARTPDGELSIIELSDLDDQVHDQWEALSGDIGSLLTEDDAIQLAGAVEPGHSAVLVLYENSWARHLTTAVLDAHGEVILNTRIPREVVAELERSAA
jgi:uncharacterized membrane protein